MLFGAHISAAGGVFKAPANAAAIGCECFQFFSRSPQGGPAPELTPEVVEKFEAECKKYNLIDYYIHTPYYINFASEKSRIKHSSISVVRQELERGTILGAKYIMTHLGSAKDLGPDQAVKQTIEGLVKVLEDYTGTTELLLEDSAGAGQIIGAEFEELGKILHGVLKKLPQAKIGVCLDTCHSFATGYDWRDEAGVNKTLKDFNKYIGLAYLKLIHVNDSMTELGSHKDRHAHLGNGEIGRAGFEAIVKNLKLKNINFILETPTEEGRIKDFKLLKKYRKK